MADYLTEQEQVQQLKNWIKQYGLTVLLGIAVALLTTYGWRYWQNYKNHILEEASRLYDEMLVQNAENHIEPATAKANLLINKYPKTPYATMAALMLGRYASAKDPKAASTQFNWVITHSKDPSIREIARIRLARLRINENKPEDALSLLNTVDDNNFISLIDEIRGDAFYSQHNFKAAKESYQLALQALPASTLSRPILKMKLNNVS